MNNKIEDLINNLFECQERLMDAETLEEIETESERSKSMIGLSNQIINIGNMALKATELKNEYGNVTLPAFLECKDGM